MNFATTLLFSRAPWKGVTVLYFAKDKTEVLWCLLPKYVGSNLSLVEKKSKVDLRGFSSNPLPRSIVIIYQIAVACLLYRRTRALKSQETTYWRSCLWEKKFTFTLGINLNSFETVSASPGCHTHTHTHAHSTLFSYSTTNFCSKF